MICINILKLVDRQSKAIAFYKTKHWNIFFLVDNKWMLKKSLESNIIPKSLTCEERNESWPSKE